MDEQRLLELTDELALQFPGTEKDHPFGPETDVYKVRGRIFLLHMELGGRRLVNLKVEPQDSVALQDEFAEVSPGYHMSKKHWVSVRAGEGLTEDLVRELVVDSYRLVVEKLPRRERPVDPETFGMTP